ncbi:MAG: SDR family NAD(P)-dependent oxidoreductase [Bilifractor sp.]|jgi:NAD(P)-dependent dehydrogenase (short-subunit alcohol dehydrogenase family)
MKLDNKVLFITGAARGLGGETAITCAGYGATIVAVDINEEGLKNTVKTIVDAGGKAIYAVADVRDRSQVQKAVQKAVDTYGKIDGLYNAAGVDRIGSIMEMSDEIYDFVMDINVKGTFICCSEVAKVMKKQNYGRIVNTSSIAAVREEANNAPYCMSKAAVAMLTRVLALELAPNITAVAIQPGNIETDMLKNSFKNRGAAEGKDVGEFYQEMRDTIPMGRIGQPSDIAEVTAWLFDDRSGYIDGNAILIAGGKIMS